MIEKHIEVISGVSLVICLRDGFSDGIPIGKINFEIENSLYKLDLKPIRNPTGYYIYKKLKAGGYKFVIGGQYYIPCSFNIAISDSDANNSPIRRVDSSMIPESSYPFWEGTTLIRGTVKGKVPLEGLEVTACWSSNANAAFLNTRTDKRGDFIIYFKDFSHFRKEGEHYHAFVDLTVKNEDMQVTKTVEAIYEREVSVYF